MNIKDIKALIKVGDYKYLPKLLASGTFNNPEWGEWWKAGSDFPENRLGHLDWAISSALSDPPDPQPTRDARRRKAKADKVRKQIDDLAKSIRSFEKEEGFTWASALFPFSSTAARELAARFPLANWQRTIPPSPRLGPGWEQGVHAGLSATPILLEALKGAVNEWEARGAWPIRANKGVRAGRTYFVKSLCYQFRLRYGAPLHGVVASLANDFFPSMQTLSAKVVAKIEDAS